MAYTTIDKPSDYFETVTYTASTSSSYSETSLQFQPDFIWLKNRDTTYPHHLFDAVRGSSLGLSSNSSDDEQTRGSSYLTSFDSNGFTTGNAIASDSADGVVAWSWKAGGTAVSNTDGDITSSVSVNTTAGFSIVSYTGSGTIGNTVGHGLGQKPAMVITKNRDATSTGVVWHQGGTSTKNTALNSNESEYDSSASGWAQGINGVPTSSVLSFTAGASGNNNVMDSSEKYISYCFAEKKGYSKFGSYEGNGNANGTYVHLGFRPAWLMVKPIDAADNWVMFDNKRHNAINSSTAPYQFYANKNFAETTDTKQLDFLSNGFKIRNSGNTVNRTSTFIYMAFAENPFVTSGGVPVNAR